MKEDQKYFYIYNKTQATFFVNNGLEVLEIQKSSQGNMYFKFLRDQKAEEVFSMWVNRNK